jgi:hypothetical protein
MKVVLLAILSVVLSECTLIYADDGKTLPAPDIIIPDNYYEALAQINPDGFENEIIDYFRQNPIILKNTNAGYLSQIPSIDYLTAIQIIDLVQLAGFDDYGQIADSLRLSDYQSELLKLCTVLKYDIQSNLSNLLKINLRSRFLVPLNESRGFSEEIYNGDKYHYYQRITVKSKDLRGGLIIDKDKGEASYADYLTAYLGYSSRNFSVIIGDYYIESGLGSTLWSPYGLKRSAEVSSVFRQWGAGIKPNVYSNENHFLRGISSDFQINMNKSLNLNISAWLSNIDRSGTVDSITGNVTSVKDDGYFQTKSDESKRNTFNELNTGACVILNNSSYMIGISGYYIKFDKYIKTESSTTMVGRDGIFSSFFGNMNFGSQKLIFELSRDNRSYFSLKSGLLFTKTNLKYGLFYRYFPKEFRSPYGYNFGQSTSPTNESGLYSFLELKVNKSLDFSAYFDFYRTISRSYSFPGVKRGFECLTELNYMINSSNSFTIRLVYENGQSIDNPNIDGKTYDMYERYTMRGQLKTRINETLDSKIKIDGALLDIINSINETGLAINWEFGYNPITNLSFHVGLSYFSTDSYNSAIWQYEYNFPGYFYSIALYGSGLRYNIGISYHPIDIINIWVKYVTTMKNNVETLGSGWDETYRNEQMGLQLQLDINL